MPQTFTGATSGFSSGDKCQLFSGSSDDPLRAGQESCSLILANTGAPITPRIQVELFFWTQPGAERGNIVCADYRVIRIGDPDSWQFTARSTSSLERHGRYGISKSTSQSLGLPLNYSSVVLEASQFQHSALENCRNSGAGEGSISFPLGPAGTWGWCWTFLMVQVLSSCPQTPIQMYH